MYGWYGQCMDSAMTDIMYSVRMDGDFTVILCK